MLTGLNPLSKLAVCLVWIVAVVLVFDARFQIAAILLGFFTLAVLNRTSPLVLLALMAPFALFGVGFLTTSLLFRKESDFALWVAGESPFSSQAFSAGMVLFLRAIACGVISLFFALTTDPGAFVRALMVYCRLPARVGYSLFAAMQMVPDFASQAQQMRLARAMKRGRPPRRFPTPFEVAQLVVPLLAFAIRRAGRMAIAMEARGLAPRDARTVTATPPFAPGDAVFIVLALGILAGCVVAVATSPG